MKKQEKRTLAGKAAPTRRKKERREMQLLGGATVAAVSLLVVSVFVVSSADRYVLSSGQYASVVAAVLVDFANTDRAQNNVGALKVNPVLVAAAQAKANDMAEYSYFAHVSPQGVDPWHWFKQAGYSFDYAGENLAVDFSDSGDVNTAWMNSPTHRENILDPHFTEIGIATAQGSYEGHPTTFVVQEFGAPSSGAQAELSNATVPKTPTETAVATAVPGATVLGDSTQQPETPAPKPVKKPIAQVPAPAKTEVLGSSVAAQPAAQTTPSTPAPRQASLWAHIFTSPRDLLEYAYWSIAFLLVLLLGFATGFEIHRHHMGKALTAGILVVFMCVMFIAANTFVFSNPTLTPNASMTAAVGAL